MAAQIEQLLLVEQNKLRMLSLLDADERLQEAWQRQPHGEQHVTGSRACRHPQARVGGDGGALEGAHGGGAGRRVNSARVRLAPISPASPGSLDEADLCVSSAHLIKAPGTGSHGASRALSGLGQQLGGYPHAAKTPSPTLLRASAAGRLPLVAKVESPSYTPPLSPADLVGLGVGFNQTAPGQAQVRRGTCGPERIASSARVFQDVEVCRLLAVFDTAFAEAVLADTVTLKCVMCGLFFPFCTTSWQRTAMPEPWR